MNVEIVAEATQFPEMEYINGIFFAVWLSLIVDNWKQIYGCSQLLY
jgi:hypothetical protein